jgi:predicted nucleotidyltransferase
MNFGLSDTVIRKMQSVIAGFPEVEEVVIYGSREKGNFKPGSDIDLTLKGNALSLATLRQMETKLDNLNLPYTIDLSIYHLIDDPAVKEHIDRVGKVLYGKKHV